MNKVELLAPAGNYEALVGAISAGADAVYLAGNAFGARAYAENFTQEQILTGIQYAHLFGKKVYLTVNTLVKEKEFHQLYDFLFPLYEGGIDGVIIQDLGVFRYIREHFPNLSLHISTQMTITGALGAKLLKEEGAERIVPARELSLSEIKEMKEEAGIEVETFIHGAMCYCYSGQCLFSSILGGRSGNRGRCAQPCRLPYQTNKQECYPLSMKDLCTIRDLPALIEAGIDSFKIEGRMKKPEYAAGVVSIYRKYIDLYYENPSKFVVSEKDIRLMESLYIRSDIMNGYYFKHNGKDMITLTSPSYNGSNDLLLEQIRRDYIQNPKKKELYAYVRMQIGEPAELQLFCDDIQVTAYEGLVQKAMKQPITKEKIKEQIGKSGTSFFDIISIEVEADDDIFLPVSTMNQLRRNALQLMQQKLTGANVSISEQKEISEKFEISKKPSPMKTPTRNVNYGKTSLHVLVNTMEQFLTAFHSGIERIYLDKELLTKKAIDAITDLYTKSGIDNFPQIYIAYPYIVRSKDLPKLNELLQYSNQHNFVHGVLVRNPETIQFLKEKNFDKEIVTDTNMYIFNRSAIEFLKNYSSESYLPLELNKHEILDITGEFPLSTLVYGYFPMMISANCIRKTTDDCMSVPGYETMKDRYQKEFCVYTDCNYCYNILYNSVPLSLHAAFKKTVRDGYYRLDFTHESGAETTSVIRYFRDLLNGNYYEPDYKDFTTGHYKRGVE